MVLPVMKKPPANPAAVVGLRVTACNPFAMGPVISVKLPLMQVPLLFVAEMR